MGVVYKAEDTTLERTIALKFLAQHLLNGAEAKEHFLREAKAAAGIDHPDIGHVHEIGEEGDKTFIAMAFLEGESLEDRISQGPPSPSLRCSTSTSPTTNPAATHRPTNLRGSASR